MLPPPMQHAAKIIINRWHCWPPYNATSRKNNQSVALLVWLWRWQRFLLWCIVPPKKQSTFGIAGLLNATSKKNKQPAALVVWLHISSSVGNVSSFDAASPQKQSTCGVAGCPPSTPCPKMVVFLLNFLFWFLVLNSVFYILHDHDSFSLWLTMSRLLLLPPLQ